MADDLQLAEATAPLSFAEFLERMKDPAAADLVRSIKNFIRAFEDRQPDPERDGELVQQFLAKSEGAFRQHPVWAAGPSEHQAQAIEGLEKYLMTKIYSKTFADSELDRERDQALHMRMKALSFVQPSHLDLPDADMEQEALSRAKVQLGKINNYKAPRDKVVCILNCSRIINGILSLNAERGKARGADDFLPILIYITIHANPPQLASNLEYIQRFRMRSRMVSESAYFFTQLYSAATFIETINASSLTIDADEFKARMIAAGLPDMQSFAGLNEEQDPSKSLHDDVSPFSGQAAQVSGKDTQATTPKIPAQVSQAVEYVTTKAKQARAAQKPSLNRQQTSSIDSMPVSLRQSEIDMPLAMSQAAYQRSLPELEEAGYRHLLKAEESGDLQKRHPFIYATAPDLRVSDVTVLLAAYKRIVLRYESLSLLLAHEHAEASKHGSQETHGSQSSEGNENVFSLRPPAVVGPNPFAGGNKGDVPATKEQANSEANPNSSSSGAQPSIVDSVPGVSLGRSERMASLARQAPRPEPRAKQQASAPFQNPTPGEEPDNPDVSLETLLHRQNRQTSGSDLFAASSPNLRKGSFTPHDLEGLAQGLSIPPGDIPEARSSLDTPGGPEIADNLAFQTKRLSQDVVFKPCLVPSMFGDESEEVETSAEPSSTQEQESPDKMDKTSASLRSAEAPTEGVSGKEPLVTHDSAFDSSIESGHLTVQPEESPQCQSSEEGKAGAGFEDSPFQASSNSEAFTKSPSLNKTGEEGSRPSKDPFPESLASQK